MSTDRLVTVPTLVIILGPIASGKNSVAQALRERFRCAGRPVAVLDLDETVETIGGFVDLPGQKFRQAQVVFGQLVGAWLQQGFDVIAHGPFFERHEHDALVHAIPDGVIARRALLHATYEIALERVTADPDRILSRHPDVLRRAYDRFAELLPTMPPPTEWTFDTTTTSVQSIVDELATALLARDPRRSRLTPRHRLMDNGPSRRFHCPAQTWLDHPYNNASVTPLPEVARPAMSTGRSPPATLSGRVLPAIGPSAHP